MKVCDPTATHLQTTIHALHAKQIPGDTPKPPMGHVVSREVSSVDPTQYMFVGFCQVKVASLDPLPTNRLECIDYESSRVQHSDRLDLRRSPVASGRMVRMPLLDYLFAYLTGAGMLSMFQL